MPINYAVQIIAARVLGLVNFGVFNSWVADVTIFLSIAALLQVFSTFSTVSAQQLKYSVLILLIVAITVSLIAFKLAWQEEKSSWLWIITILPLSLASAWVVGQLQSRLLFGKIGALGLIGATAKLVMVTVGFGNLPELMVFYLSFTLANAVAAIALSIWCLYLPLQDIRDQNTGQPIGNKLTNVAILTLASSLLPQLDLICLRQSVSESTLGAFAQVSLFGRGIWYLIATGLQITLPLRIRAKKTYANGNEVSLAITVETMMIILGATAAIVCTFLGPFMMQQVLGIPNAVPRKWILLNCLCAVVLCTTLAEIQQHCTEHRWKSAAMILCGLISYASICSMLNLTNVDAYLIVALCFYSVVLGLSKLSNKFRLAT